MKRAAPAVAAKEEFEKELATDSLDANILDYCSLDPQVPPPRIGPLMSAWNLA